MAATVSSQPQSVLEIFEEEMKAVKFIGKRAKTVGRLLKSRRERARLQEQYALKDLDNAEALGLPKDGLEGRLQRLTKRFKIVRGEEEKWESKAPHRQAIAYCVAFETFLLDYLIDQLRKTPTLLEGYLISKINHSAELGLVLEITNLPIDENDVYECIVKDFGTFDKLINSAYKSFLGVKPFEELILGQTVFDGEDTRKAALTDIRLLFGLRNKLVHRGGKPDVSYRNYVNDFRCRSRVCEEALKNYPEPEFPEPDLILASKAKDSNKNKLDEIADSLSKYAGYIAEVC